MPQEDYFKRKFDQLAIALAKLLDRFLQLKSTGLLHEDLQKFNADLKTEIGFTLTELTDLSPEAVMAGLREKKLNDLHLDMLSEMLFQQAQAHEEHNDITKANALYAKLILLYEQLASRDPIYSLERHMRLEKMKKKVAG
jgi:hypothetical protein